MPALISRLLPFWKTILLALSLLLAVYSGWHARAVVEQARDAEEGPPRTVGVDRKAVQ